MKTYKFDMTEDVSVPINKKAVDETTTNEKATDIKEKTTKKKSKKNLPVLGIGATLISVVAIGVSLFALLCASLPSILEFAYYLVGILDYILYIFHIDSSWIYEIFNVIYYPGDLYYTRLSHFQILIMIINHWRDILLLVVSAIGALLSGVSLLVNIKGKNHLATGIGATALSISLVAGVNLIASIVYYFLSDFWTIIGLIMSLIELF